VHGTEGVDHVGAGIAVVERCCDQVEALPWHFGVLDVRAKGLRHAFERERYRNAAPADGNDQPRPGGRERLVGGHKIQQTQVGLQPRWQEAHGAGHLHLLQAVGKADRFGHRNALRLHAD
jgi:hypothetical protein